MLLSRSPPKSQQRTKSGGSSPAKISNTSATKSVSNLSSPPLASSSSTSFAASSRSTAHSPLLSGNSTCRTGSSLSLYSNSSTTALLPEGIRSNNSGSVSGSNSSRDTNSGFKSTTHSHYHHHHYMQHSHSHYGSSGGGGIGGGGRKSGSSSSVSSKRGKKSNWGSRERAGMSFLIVIAFFAVFGLIILTELFMIDEKTHGGMIVLRHGNQGSRLGDSMPDYDNVKDDYELLDDSLLSDNKLGFVQFHDNKLKIQDASTGDAGRSQAGILFNSAANGYVVGAGVGTGVGGGGGSASVPIIPWGKVLPNKIEETLPRYPIGMQPTDGSWQVVNGTRFKFFVFSAYYDRRDGAKLVRVIGATKTRGPERVWCRFWYVNSRNGTETPMGRQIRASSATVMARVKIIRENWNLKYSACFVLCPIRAPDIAVPQYVSIVSRLRAPPGNFLELRNTDSDPDFTAYRSSNIRATMGNTSYASSASSSQVASSSSSSATATSSALPTGDQIPDKIAICVKPFHFNYDQALYLMEYLEFYALMGVSHFTFYNHTTGPHSTCVLRHYMNGDVPDLMTATDEDYTVPLNSNAATNAQQTQNQQQQQQKPIKHRISTNYVKPTINILPWNLRMRSQKEIRTEGLFAALNDCLYRTMFRYKYLALVDLDEFIIPRNNDTLNELINSLNQRFRNRNTGAYSFQNAFFYLQFADDPLVYQEPEKSLNPRLRAALVTQRKTRRRFKLHPQKQRSKYICRPEAVIEAGNHFVWEFSPGRGSLNVPPSDAILHHYRVCEFGGNDCIKAPSTIDRTATKYANRLLQRVDAVYNYLKEPCDLPDLPKLPQQPPAVTLAQKQQQQQPQPQPPQQQPQQSQQPATPTKPRITKIINDFKVKLREKMKANNEHRTTNSTQSGTSTIPSATDTKDNEYDDPNRIVVFEQDANGQTIVQVKYAIP